MLGPERDFHAKGSIGIRSKLVVITCNPRQQQPKNSASSHLPAAAPLTVAEASVSHSFPLAPVAPRRSDKDRQTSWVPNREDRRVGSGSGKKRGWGLMWEGKGGLGLVPGDAPNAPLPTLLGCVRMTPVVHPCTARCNGCNLDAAPLQLSARSAARGALARMHRRGRCASKARVRPRTHAHMLCCRVCERGSVRGVRCKGHVGEIKVTLQREIWEIWVEYGRLKPGSRSCGRTWTAADSALDSRTASRRSGKGEPSSATLGPRRQRVLGSH